MGAAASGPSVNAAWRVACSWLSGLAALVVTYPIATGRRQLMLQVSEPPALWLHHSVTGFLRSICTTRETRSNP